MCVCKSAERTGGCATGINNKACLYTCVCVQMFVRAGVHAGVHMCVCAKMLIALGMCDRCN